ncbi:peptidylprolyl isomerase [Flavobacteriaceae bacterium XHP0103]|nr:peptidylprolyl isomerase [Marixanthotalea marina]
MLLKTNNLKYTISNSQLFVLGVLMFLVNLVGAQEIIEEDVEVAANNEVVDNTFKPHKIDGIAGVVGDYIVLDSDIAKERRQLIASGANLQGVTDCELFGSMLERKLLAHHAIQDSLEVSDAEVRQRVDVTIDQFLQQRPINGSMEKLIEFYGKENERSFREELFEIIKANNLADKMQAKIVEDVEITPDEVREFFNKIPKDKRPTFGTELKVAEIVVEPKVSQEAKQVVIDRLKEFKRDVEDNGASFRTKAVLYSEDKVSARNGGQVGSLDRKKTGGWAKEFRETTFSTQEGEISEPFATEFGYHILKVDRIRGQIYDVSHILLFPKVSDEAIKEARDRTDKIRESIVSGAITFEEAARESSDRKETKVDGGQMINPETQDYNFELTRMDTDLYAQIQNLKDGEVSPVLTETDRTGNLKYKILQITDRIDEHEADFARDYMKIKELALNEKRIKTIEKWQKEKIMDTYIKIGSSYNDCNFSGNWLKK